MSREMLYGKYLFEKHIGSGMSGHVSLVTYKNRKCALKTVQARYYNSIETESMAKLKHQNIISLIEVDERSNFIVIIMEYCNLGSIKNYQKTLNDQVYSEQQAKYAFHQILDAVEYLHNSGFMHRDIKPDNILIHEEKGKKIYKLADFGFCTGNQIAMSQIGTPYFLAPQLITGEYVWALGVTLFNMLTNKYPFEGKQSFEKQILSDIQKKCSPRFKYQSDNPILNQLFQRIFKIKPQNRISMNDLKNHPFFKKQTSKIYNIPSNIKDCSSEQKKIPQQQQKITLQKPLSKPNSFIKKQSLQSSTNKSQDSPTKKITKDIESYYSQLRQRNLILLLLVKDLKKYSKNFKQAYHHCLIFNTLKLFLIYENKIRSQLQKMKKDADLKDYCSTSQYIQFKRQIQSQIQQGYKLFIQQTDICEKNKTQIQKQFNNKCKILLSSVIQQKDLSGQFKQFYRSTTSLCYQNIKISNKQDNIILLKFKIFLCHGFNRIFESKNTLSYYYEWIAPRKELNAELFFEWLHKDKIETIELALKRIKQIWFKV